MKPSIQEEEKIKKDTKKYKHKKVNSYVKLKISKKKFKEILTTEPSENIELNKNKD